MKSLMFIPILALCACVQATASDKVEDTVEVQVPNLLASYAGTQVPSTTLPTQDEPFDVSGPLSDLSKVGTLSVHLDHNTLSTNGDFSYLDEVKITMRADDNNSSGLSPITLIDLVPTADQKQSGSMEVPLLVDDATLLQYFSSGGLVMSFTLTVSGSIPATPTLDLSDDILLDVSLSVDKSINDIGK